VREKDKEKKETLVKTENRDIKRKIQKKNREKGAI